MNKVMLDIAKVVPTLHHKGNLAADHLDESDTTFECPKYDEGLKDLIEFVGGPRALYLAWFEGVWKIEHAATVRRRIDAKVNGGNATKKVKRGDYLNKLGC